MREMLSLQPRFRTMSGKRAMNLLEHRRFRAAYDFMVLMAEVGLVDPSLAEFWSEVQTLPANERAARFNLKEAGTAKRRRKRRRRPSGRRGDDRANS